MKKTIKIIDLLNKIANGEEVPKKIKYNDDEYIHIDNYCYFCEETNEILSQNTYAEFSRLNDEVEILDEEEFEDIKPLVLRTFERTGQAITTDRLEDYCDYNFEMIENTIAKIVLNQKKIIQKLNKDN